MASFMKVGNAFTDGIERGFSPRKTAKLLNLAPSTLVHGNHVGCGMARQNRGRWGERHCVGPCRTIIGWIDEQPWLTTG